MEVSTKSFSVTLPLGMSQIAHWLVSKALSMTKKRLMLFGREAYFTEMK